MTGIVMMIATKSDDTIHGDIMIGTPTKRKTITAVHGETVALIIEVAGEIGEVILTTIQMTMGIRDIGEMIGKTIAKAGETDLRIRRVMYDQVALEILNPEVYFGATVRIPAVRLS